MPRRGLLLALLLCLVAVAGAPRTTISFAWDYPDNDAEVFKLYSSTDLSVPFSSWALVTNAPGGSNRTLTIPLTGPGPRWYVLTVSNLAGESNPSDPAKWPGLSSPRLRIF